jgi:hypothetical protein
MVHARVDKLEETAMSENGGHCPLGGSEKQPGTTTLAVDLTFSVVIMEAPAFVWSLSGNASIDDPVAGKLEGIVAETRRKQVLVEVMQWPQVARAGASHANVRRHALPSVSRRR